MDVVKSALGAIWGFLVRLYHLVIGDRLDSGWVGLLALICLGVVTVVFLIGGINVVKEWTKAADIRFNKSKLDKDNLERPDGTAARQIDWAKARTQQVRSWRFTVPLGVLVAGTLYYWVRWPFTLEAYFWLAVGWLVFSPLLRVWWIATAVWTERKLLKTEPAAAVRSELHGVSVGWALRHYLNWGLQKSTIKRRPYIGLFRIFNPFVWIFQLKWLQVRLVRPVVICAFYALFWALATPIAVFYLTRELRERRPILKPEWASTYAQEPTYGSGAIPDTPGDAAAAFGS